MQITMMEFCCTVPMPQDAVAEMLTKAVNDMMQPLVEGQGRMISLMRDSGLSDGGVSGDLALHQRGAAIDSDLVKAGRRAFEFDGGGGGDDEDAGPLGKRERGKAMESVKQELNGKLFERDRVAGGVSGEDGADHPLVDDVLRRSFGEIFFDGQGESEAVARSDGRGTEQLRPLTACTPALPDKVHGSSFFSRGETQALCTVTLGPPQDSVRISNPYRESRMSSKWAVDREKNGYPVGSLRSTGPKEIQDSLDLKKWESEQMLVGHGGAFDKEEYKRAYLQYDFPAYSTGEVGGRPGPNRRSIGHGNLAERAILPILPKTEAFPYVVRMTSEVRVASKRSE